MKNDKLQRELDEKKWNDSIRENRDTCGEYEYCKFCDMAIENPCASAYDKMGAASKPTKPAKAKKKAIK